ncbi:hypothetical protein C4F40_14730 [Sphingobacterium sp. Ka21]|uniref:HTH araC/xylS-type domain-containing protein n=1 Tax=Sphingobacterium pedocola TaxID=2082722 RepID=A0ABR9T9E8_9SPHI|nr:hypothetical protein [Sphingobacterium pedocola]
MSQIVSGQTAQERIEVKVIDVAKQLLASTNLSVAEIAERLGFSQPQLLNRLFKKHTQNILGISYINHLMLHDAGLRIQSVRFLAN